MNHLSHICMIVLSFHTYLDSTTASLGHVLQPYLEEKLILAPFTRIGYVQIRLGSDLPWYGSTLLTRNRFPELKLYGSIRDHLHKWTHFVPDSRCDRYRIHQVQYKYKAYPYQFDTNSKRIRSRVNAAFISIDRLA